MKTLRQLTTAARPGCVLRIPYSVFRVPCTARNRPLHGTRNTEHGARRCAFTLIELMVVVAIMALVLTMGIPFMRTAVDGGKGMTRAVKDVQEACSHARAMAILQRTTTELVIRPGDGAFEVARSSSTKPMSHEGGGGDAEPPPTKPAGGGGFSIKLPTGITIEGLGVNGEDWTEDPVARVRFYSNGTSDEMSVILLSDKNERRNIWLEVVTGLPEMETDPYKFKKR